MAKKFVTLNQAAGLLGISEDELGAMRERGEIRAFRDGKGWKFREDEVERVTRELATRGPDSPGDEEFGASDLISDSQIGGSSTIIGGSDRPASPQESDLKLAEEAPASGGSELQLESDLKLGESDVKKDGSGVGSQFEDLEESHVDGGSELNLAGDENLVLGEEDPSLSEVPTAIQKGKGTGSGSSVDLAAAAVDEEGSGGTGSDITLDASESGISLGPSDSGLSLDEPLELGGSAVDAFELGEDDSIVLDDDMDSPTQLQADDDFLLTPMADDDDDLGSDSQVIALDEEDPFEAAAAPGGALDVAPLEAHDPSAATAAMTMAMAPALPEAPYSFWNLLSLFCCIIFLMLTGMMMFELVENMTGWDAGDSVAPGLMDAVYEAVKDFM